MKKHCPVAGNFQRAVSGKAPPCDAKGQLQVPTRTVSAAYRALWSAPVVEPGGWNADAQPEMAQTYQNWVPLKASAAS